MDTTPQIRPAGLDDISAIEAIAVAAGMFTPEDVGFLGHEFTAVQAGERGEAHWLVVDDGGTVVGSAYYAPEPFADRMWNLYFLAVAPNSQGRGLGGLLIRHIEAVLAACGESVARTLIIETSSTADYEPTRAFYTRLGYVQEARIREFYGPEDDKVVFWKSLTRA